MFATALCYVHLFLWFFFFFLFSFLVFFLLTVGIPPRRFCTRVWEGEQQLQNKQADKRGKLVGFKEGKPQAAEECQFSTFIDSPKSGYFSSLGRPSQPYLFLNVQQVCRTLPAHKFCPVMSRKPAFLVGFYVGPTKRWCNKVKWKGN